MLFLASLLPRPLDRIRHMLAVRRRQTDANAEIGQFGMRIVPAMEFRDRLGIDLAGRGLHDAVLEMSLELALQCDEERRAVVDMPICKAARHDLRAVDLHL